MSTQYGIDNLGTYRTRNSKLRGYLTTLDRSVTVPMVDRFLFQEVKSLGISLDVERDNKSVTEPEWFWKGLNRYACPVHASETHTAGVLCSCGKDDRSARAGRHVGRGHDNGTRADTSGGSVRTRSSEEAVRSSLRDDVRNGSTPNNGGANRDRARAQARPNRATLRRALQAVRRVVLQTPDGVSPLTVDEVVEHHLRGSAASGLPYLGHNHDPGQKDRGRRLASRAILGQRGLDPYLFGRRVSHGPSGPKTRLVWMAPLATTIVGGIFSVPLQRALSRVRPFTWGHKDAERGAIISEFDGRFRYIYGTDYSRFDSSVPAFLLKEVFAILREGLDMEESLESAWELIVRDFIHTRILGPDGNVHQKHRGIPSGSAFTSLVGSIVNLVLTQYVWMSATGQELPFDAILVMGDDALFASDRFVSPQEMKRYAGELGFVLNPEKTGVTSGAGVRHSMEEWPHFLGYYWVNGVPHRPEEEIAMRMALPEHHREQDLKLSNQRKVGYAMTCRQGYRMVLEMSGESRIMLACIEVMRDAQSDEPIKPQNLPGSLRQRVAVEGQVLSFTDGNPIPILLGQVH